jgi:hypothetical protein
MWQVAIVAKSLAFFLPCLLTGSGFSAGMVERLGLTPITFLNMRFVKEEQKNLSILVKHCWAEIVSTADILHFAGRFA